MATIMECSRKIHTLTQLAIEEAKHSEFESYRHGAILFRSTNEVISKGHNRYGSRICSYCLPSIHAEMDCMHHIYRKSHVSRRHGQCYQGACSENQP